MRFLRAFGALALGAFLIGACGTFRADEDPPPPDERDAGLAPTSDAAAPTDGALPEASACTPLAEWRLDFASALPAEYTTPNNNVPAAVAGGMYVATATINPGGAPYRGRFQRELEVPSGLDRAELEFVVEAGSAPVFGAFEIGCSLTLRPEPTIPQSDKRFVLRATASQMQYQWGGSAPALIPNAFASLRHTLKLTVQLDGAGTGVQGVVEVDANPPARLDTTLVGIPRALRLECGLISGNVTASDAGTSTYEVHVDDVRLALCARL